MGGDRILLKFPIRCGGGAFAVLWAISQDQVSWLHDRGWWPVRGDRACGQGDRSWARIQSWIAPRASCDTQISSI
ncbi:MAG: hypothetical protein EA001_13950 [Oscillatoriales cyanobacterium]|nr:MAG: hypothetical protein EA001_13950 [Oscillatoriales cyanobacterium]